MSGWGTLPAYAQVVSPNPESDFFYANGQVIPVSLASDEIGVLINEDSSLEELQERIANSDLVFKQQINEVIGILKNPDPLDRLELAQLARKLESDNSEIIAEAGLVVTPLKAETPLIVSDEFIVQFKPEVSIEEILKFNQEFGVKIVMENPYTDNQFVVTVTENTGMTALELSNLYEESALIRYAHPNFIQDIENRQATWHNNNIGLTGGTFDADIDAPEAWDITQGTANVLIAVIDSGFDTDHPDLLPNRWKNPGEIPSNGVDDDANGRDDDIYGWDFEGDDNDPTGYSDEETAHGTAVAGAAAATGSNALGVTGSCQRCNLMFLRRGYRAIDQGLPFDYARANGADIIISSWGFRLGIPTLTNVKEAVEKAATEGRDPGDRRDPLGSVVLFAMSNEKDVNRCSGSTADISSSVYAIAVSRSTNQDQFDFSGVGNCMDLLAPSAYTDTVSDSLGTLWVTTTDLQGSVGYNNTNPLSPSCPSTEVSLPPPDGRNYTECFNGTSFSASLTAGVVGLVLSENPDLSRLQVQRLLQDTADKIEDSTADYEPDTGFSSPPPSNIATHGYGRVNAFEAVRVAAPVTAGGKGGVDIFLRDNYLDWGNTEQPSNTRFEATRGFIGHWESMDIKVDAPDPDYASSPITTSATFDAFVDETPSAVSGDINKVYVRVRNRGPETASTTSVKLYWSQFGTALPALPADFWTDFPNIDSTDTSQWHPLNCSGSTSSICTISALDNSGSSVAASIDDPDTAQIVQFDFPAPGVDSSLPNHFCLLAMVDSPQDRVLPKARAATIAEDFVEDFVVDTLTPTDNNVTHRNYLNLSTTQTSRFEESFFVRNPYSKAIRSALRLKAPKGWKITLDRFSFDEPFTLEPNAEVLVTMTVTTPRPGSSGAVTVIQEKLEPQKRILGGVTYEFQPDLEEFEIIQEPCCQDLTEQIENQNEMLFKLTNWSLWLALVIILILLTIAITLIFLISMIYRLITAQNRLNISESDIRESSQSSDDS